jgi:hypothetical protein
MAYQGGEESCRPNEPIIPYWYSLSMIILSRLFGAGWRVSAAVRGWERIILGKKVEERQRPQAPPKCAFGTAVIDAVIAGGLK